MKRRVTVFVLFVVVCAVLIWLFQHRWSLEQLIERERWLREMVRQHPGLAFLTGFCVYIAASLIPGTPGKAIAYGWIFGFVQGLALVSFGLTIAATISLLLSRHLLRDAIHSRWGHFVVHIDRALAHDGPFYLFTLRLLHFPYTITNYAMGATRIRTVHFWWATQLGLLPSTILFVYTGSHLPTLQAIADQGIWGVVSPRLLILLSLLGIVPIAVRLLWRRYWPTHTPPPHL